VYKNGIKIYLYSFSTSFNLKNQILLVILPMDLNNIHEWQAYR